MRFTNAAGYGIAACSHLAALPADQVAANSAVCRAFKMPDRFVSQVMLQLTQAGVVASIKGCDGGYRLAKLARKITLLEIIEAVDGPIGGNDVAELAGVSKDGQAMVEGAYAAAAAELRKRLTALTLSSLRAAKAA